MERGLHVAAINNDFISQHWTICLYNVVLTLSGQLAMKTGFLLRNKFRQAAIAIKNIINKINSLQYLNKFVSKNLI